MKVYIASPFFNEEQLERVQFIENTLKELDYDFFSPRLDTYVKPDSTHEERLKAFQDNLKGINDADFVLAVTDGKDVGTIFEAGYAYEHTPILYFAETLGDKPFNLMLAMSAKLGTCKSREELKYKLNEIKKFNLIEDYILNNEDKYQGEIE